VSKSQLTKSWISRWFQSRIVDTMQSTEYYRPPLISFAFSSLIVSSTRFYKWLLGTTYPWKWTVIQTVMMLHTSSIVDAVKILVEFRSDISITIFGKIRCWPVWCHWLMLRSVDSDEDFGTASEYLIVTLVHMEKIARERVGERLIQHEAKPSTVLGSRPTP